MKKCMDCIFYLAAFLGILLVSLLVLPLCIGIHPRIVLSGSMEPMIPVGSIAYVDSGIPADDIRELDVISYRRGEKMRVLHRVVRTKQDQKCFLTKGDANEAPDLGTVPFSQYEGKEVFSIPYLGYLVQYLQEGNHLVFLIGILVLLLAIDSVWKYKKDREKRRNTGGKGKLGNNTPKLVIPENILGKKGNE